VPFTSGTVLVVAVPRVNVVVPVFVVVLKLVKLNADVGTIQTRELLVLEILIL